MQGFSRSEDEAVSPVIGTILIIALTIVIAGIFASVLLGYTAGEPAPILGISIGQEGNIITMTHLNGAVLPAGTYKILVDGVEKDFGATGIFSPGMTLRWDSGTEAVGTVSVVYTDTSGKSTVLVQKTIGKAGSGGSGFEDRYTIITRVNWQTFLDEVNASQGGLTLGNGIVYVDNGEYWASYDNQYMQKSDAASNPTIGTYVEYRINHNLSPGLLKINISNKIFTSADIIDSNHWKNGVVITQGSLFEDDSGKLFIWVRTYFPIPSDKTNWLEIASRKT